MAGMDLKVLNQGGFYREFFFVFRVTLLSQEEFCCQLVSTCQIYTAASSLPVLSTATYDGSSIKNSESVDVMMRKKCTIYLILSGTSSV